MIGTFQRTAPLAGLPPFWLGNATSPPSSSEPPVSWYSWDARVAAALTGIRPLPCLPPALPGRPAVAEVAFEPPSAKKLECNGLLSIE